jgi:hypothetical protein
VITRSVDRVDQSDSADWTDEVLVDRINVHKGPVVDAVRDAERRRRNSIKTFCYMAVERGVSSLTICMGRDVVAVGGGIWRGLGAVEVKDNVGEIRAEVSRRIRRIRRWHGYQEQTLLRGRKSSSPSRSVSDV